MRTFHIDVISTGAQGKEANLLIARVGLHTYTGPNQAKAKWFGNIGSAALSALCQKRLSQPLR